MKSSYSIVAQPLAGAGELGIVVVDHQRLDLGERQRLLHHLGELAVGDQHLGLGVIELERDHRGVEPGVDGVEHRAGHRHAVVAFEHRRRVGEHGRDGVAAGDAALRQGRREPARARIELGVAPAQRPVDDGGVVGKHRRRPRQERERRERLEIRRVAVEIEVVGRLRHGGPLRRRQSGKGSLTDRDTGHQSGRCGDFSGPGPPGEAAASCRSSPRAGGRDSR